jgi:hypothetical protein
MKIAAVYGAALFTAKHVPRSAKSPSARSTYAQSCSAQSSKKMAITANNFPHTAQCTAGIAVHAAALLIAKHVPQCTHCCHIKGFTVACTMHIQDPCVQIFEGVLL